MNNYSIIEIEETIAEMKLINLVGNASEATIFRLDEEIIDLLNDFTFPTIHDTIEAVLYYITWTDKLVEFEYYLTRFLYSKDSTDSIIIAILNTITNNNIIEKIEMFLTKNSVGNERYFNGWTTHKSNINFNMNFDFVMLDSLPIITTRKQ